MMVHRFTSFSADIDQRLHEVVETSNRKCDEVNAKLSDEINRVDEMRGLFDFRLDKLERLSLEKDLIITGVPVENDDNPFGVIGHICKALHCDLNQRDFVSVYRQKSNNANAKTRRSVPIVARLHENWAKQELLS